MDELEKQVRGSVVGAMEKWLDGRGGLVVYVTHHRGRGWRVSVNGKLVDAVGARHVWVRNGEQLEQFLNRLADVVEGDPSVLDDKEKRVQRELGKLRGKK